MDFFALVFAVRHPHIWHRSTCSDSPMKTAQNAAMSTMRKSQTRLRRMIGMEGEDQEDSKLNEVSPPPPGKCGKPFVFSCRWSGGVRARQSVNVFNKIFFGVLCVQQEQICVYLCSPKKSLAKYKSFKIKVAVTANE